jgi:hypothetical protein
MQAGLTQLVSFPPAGGPGKYLNEIGRHTPAVYSYAASGGCDQLTSTFQKPPSFTSDALDQGRIIQGVRGTSVVWEGILDEPAAGADGMALTCQGVGKQGDQYRMLFAGSWGSGVPDDAVNQAIGRGLRWKNPGIGTPSGMWMGQPVDYASQTITDLLDLICHKGGLMWTVTTTSTGNVLNVFQLPTVANRLLVSADPASQSIAGEPDVIYGRFQQSADAAVKANYSTTNSTSPGLIASTGRREDFLDISSAGVQTSGSTQTVLSNVLKRYQRAAFTQSFDLKYGELLNLGGTPVDPGAPYADGMTAMVCRALLADFTFSGELQGGPVTFIVGQYQWDDGARIATVTPFGALRQDFASLLSLGAETVPARVLHHDPKKKKGKHK